MVSIRRALLPFRRKRRSFLPVWWFPDFKEYALTHEMRKRPAKLYLSLGDREANTRNSVLMAVQRNTEELAEHYRSLGLDVTWELNPGNHFKDAALRSAKGIKAILE